MADLVGGAGTSAFLGYVLVFALAAAAVFASITRARTIEDPDTRRGLVWLLFTSGSWAVAHVGYLLAPTPATKSALYTVGLIVGISAVGPWLYFCSAYTGRSLHRNVGLRRVAIAVFLVVVLIKLTNPVHQLYYTAEMVSTPFTHLAVHSGPFHWMAMGLAYALATVGYFMLLERFVSLSYDTRPLLALVVVTGLPVVLDVVGAASDVLIEMTYEPLGVAAFSLGVFFVYFEQFHAVRLTSEASQVTLVLSDDGRILDYNEAAAELFKSLRSGAVIGEPLDAVLPAVADVLDREESILTRRVDGTDRYFQLSDSGFEAGEADMGRIVSLTDITEREQYRRELERQNERLERFADLVSHDIRNPLNVAQGRLELAREEGDSEHLEAVSDAHDRIQTLIEDLLALARQGQPIDELEPTDLGEVVDRAWGSVETHEATLSNAIERTVQADGPRLQQLFENLFRNAIEHGGSAVSIDIGELEAEPGFYLEDDGPGIAAEDRESVLEFGFTTAAEGTGFGLAIVKEIAEAHGWSVRVTEGSDGGARFEFSGL